MLPGSAPKAPGVAVAPVPVLDEEDPRASHRAEDVAKAKGKAVGPPPKKASGKGAGKAKAAAAPKASGAPLPPVFPAPLPPPAAAPPVPAAFEFVPAASSSGAERPPKKVRRAKRDLFIPAIGGGEALYEEYPNAETGVDYQNWQFKCPHHPDCVRTRGVAPRNIKQHGFYEPIAFLHAWRDTPPGPRGHRLTNPSPQAVADFFNAHEPGLAALWTHFATP